MPMGMRNEQRKVFFDNECEAALKTWLAERVSHEKNALFSDSRGKRLSYKSIGTLVKKAVNKSGIHESVTPIDFRRTFSEILVVNGCSYNIVHILLGHAPSQLIGEMVFLPNKEHLRQEYLRAMPRFGI
jgi:site-specific recombinase XerD